MLETVETLSVVGSVVAVNAAQPTGGTPDQLAALRSNLRDARTLAFNQAVEIQSLKDRLVEAESNLATLRERQIAFVSRVSHEIRSPLAAILGYTQLLLESGTATSRPASFDARSSPESSTILSVCRAVVSSDGADALVTGQNAPASADVPAFVPWLHVIHRNAQNLLAVVSDVVDYARIEAAQIEMHLANVFPARAVHEVLDTLGQRARQKGLSVQVRFDGLIPEQIVTDGNRLRQILTNLVENAIKYTHSGEVAIVVAMATSHWDESPRLSFRVEDTGGGISEEWQQKLFQTPLTALSSGLRSAAGTGLGLPVSYQLAKLLGGTLSVQSKLGKGSTFTLTIATGALGDTRLINPGATDPDNESDLNSSTRQAEPSKLSARVLIVEDGIDNQRLLKMLLRRAGAETGTASNGLEGVSAAVEALNAGAPFDIILMDIQMPEMDGYTATRELRARGVWQPIVALTANALERDRELCLAAGCDDFLTKPVDSDVLIQTLFRWLDEARKGARAVRTA